MSIKPADVGKHSHRYSSTCLLCEALEQLLHVRGEVLMQTAERPQHAPDHLQSQTVKLRQLVEEQRVHRPARRDGEESRFIIAFNEFIK